MEEQVVDGQSPHVSIVLPCYNEEDHVLLEIERICAAMDASGYAYELLAVDDCSTDSTLARLREAEDRYEHLNVVAFHRISRDDIYPILHSGQRQHHAIVDAIEAGQADIAEALMRGHSGPARRSLGVDQAPLATAA